MGADGHPQFFKYLSATAAQAVLRNRTLRWSTPGTLNDPFDAQFDLRAEIDRLKVKAATLDRLWDAHYGENPAPAGNRLGEVIQAFRGVFPRLSREDFDREFGEAIDQALDKTERSL